ncbi:hypothetical protein D9757_004924 [Collybiopsis confluens]|uniref:Uncharacterized protein n=1 Tax=Collybiopsis confluens TaxID=2823264 RepID=A0A8H5HTP9_9AGAR|nr:hypothetical protein D9757_004924 [Collybiopsis confluens]
MKILETPKTSSHDTELFKAQNVNSTIASTSGTKPGDKTTAENNVNIAKIVEPATTPKAKPGPAPVNPLASTRVPHMVPIPDKSEFSTSDSRNCTKPLAKDLPMFPISTSWSLGTRNLFAADYLKTNSPTVGEFIQIWQNISKEQAKVWESRMREAKKLSKANGNASVSTNPASETEKENMAVDVYSLAFDVN